MGKAFKSIGVPREHLIVATKVFRYGPGENTALESRKHIIEGCLNSLKRLQLDYVDLIYAHRPDYDTSVEETCRAFHWLIENNKAFYWATSEWPADRITKAMEVCERLGLHKPICDQPEYNMLCRDRVEKEHRRVFSEYGYGCVVWSPLAGGLLTGKYNSGVLPEGSRYQNLRGEHPFVEHSA
jgi:aryl-alcohol dehydrogenase-like predicted oxidoreductase